MLLKASMTERCIFGALRNIGDQQLEKLKEEIESEKCEKLQKCIFFLLLLECFFQTSLSNGSPSKRNWSASLSELPTAMKGPCFTSFSLGLSILLLLLSVSSLGPIVCTWSTQLLLCCSLLSPFLLLALLWPSLPTAAAHSTTELSCQMPLPVSWLFSTFPLEFKGVLYKGELCTKRRIKGNKTKKNLCGQICQVAIYKIPFSYMSYIKFRCSGP